MKRFLVRLSALAGIVVLGLIAIAQAQRAMKGAQDPPTESNVAAADTSDDAGRDSTAGKTATFDSDEPLANPFKNELNTSRGLVDASRSLAADDTPVTPPETIGNGDAPPWDQRHTDDTATAVTADDNFPTAEEVPGDSTSGNVVRAQSNADGRPSAAGGGLADRYTGRRYEQPVPAGPSGQDTERESSPSVGSGSAGFDQASEAASLAAAPPANGQYGQADGRYADARGQSSYDPGRAPAGLSAADASLAERIAGGPDASENDAYGHSGDGGPLPAASEDRFSDAEPLNGDSYGEGPGLPGHQRLEGIQTPSLSVEKIAPKEVQVDNATSFEIRVRNTGTAAARDVEVHDVVPKRTRLVGTEPLASRGNNGELVWSLGTMEPGEEARLVVQLMPIAEGEIGSVATVRFRADVSVRTQATRPELVVEVSAPSDVMIGDDVTYDIKVSNVGSGTATGIVLVQHLPENLEHPAGSELEYDIGTLKPDEASELQLTLRAVGPGPVNNTIIAQADGNVRAEQEIKLEVIAPALELAIKGPKKRYLERPATYTVSVSNPGTATAKEIELVTYLPPGMKFVKADNYGHYDPQTRAVYWLLEELPPQEKGSVTLVALPVETGEHKLRVEGAAEQGLSVKGEQTVRVEGVAAILFEVVDVEDPVEVGAETMYEIRVVNQGTKAATNVQLDALLPAGMQVVGADGPTRHVVDQGRITFDPLARLAPKADTTYRIRVQAIEPGDMRVRVHLKTDEMSTPVTKEESTQAYADE